MFCTNCGSVLEEGAVFCSNCGTRVEEEPVAQAPVMPTPEMQQAPVMPTPEMQQAPVMPAPEMQQTPVMPAPVKKPNIFVRILKSKITWIVTAVLLISAGVLTFFLLQPKKFNLEDGFVTFACDGFEGYGKVNAEVLEEPLYRQILKAKGYDSEKATKNHREDIRAIKDGIDSIELTVKPNGNLHNGDSFTVEITYDNELMKKQRVVFEGASLQSEVKGLLPIQEIDPFENIEPSIEGLSGYAYATFTYPERDYLYRDLYVVENDRDGSNGRLSNGDTVTLSYNVSDEETLERGFMLTRKSVNFTVNGLQEVVTSYSDIPASTLQEMREQATNIIYKWTEGLTSSYGIPLTLNNLEYAGYAFLNPKDAYSEFYNRLYILYKADLSDANTGDTAVVYYPLYVSNIMRKDGDYSFDEPYEILGYDVLPWNQYDDTYGYFDPLSLINQYISYYTLDCDVTYGDGFELYGNLKQFENLSDMTDAQKAAVYQLTSGFLDQAVNFAGVSNVSIASVNDIGTYFFVSPNPNDNSIYRNCYFSIFEVQVKSTKKKFQPMTVYVPVGIQGLINHPNGELVIKGVPFTLGEVSEPKTGYTFGGYTDLTSLDTALKSCFDADFKCDIVLNS